MAKPNWREQHEVLARLRRLTPHKKASGIASVGLLVIMAVYEGYTQFES